MQIQPEARSSLMKKFGVYVHPERPKVPAEQVVEKIMATAGPAGMKHSQGDPDVAVVVGGDGTFGYCGRTLPPSIPMLFVGVSEPGVLGSKARLAGAVYEDLGKAMALIASGRYLVVEKEMLSVRLNDLPPVDVLTDVYLERGMYAGCIRYTLSVEGKGDGGKERSYHYHSSFTEHAIGNGVIVSTPFGSGGYYSYPQRLARGAWGRTNPAQFGAGRLGICHIVPAFLARQSGKRKGGAGAGRAVRTGEPRPSARIQYTVPAGSYDNNNDDDGDGGSSNSATKITIMLARAASARLYGTTSHTAGVKVDLGDRITISRSERVARIIKLQPRSAEIKRKEGKGTGKEEEKAG